MAPYLMLAVAVVCEVFGDSMMKLSHGFEKKGAPHRRGGRVSCRVLPHCSNARATARWVHVRSLDRDWALRSPPSLARCFGRSRSTQRRSSG